ncbi:MAG: COG4280 domain-containing protein [Acidimicrobiales bacterium]
MLASISGSTTTIVLVGAVFLAASVEMVEALTIVIAVGHTRGWRSALEGAALAILALGALVAIFGPALVRIPLDPLRLVVGTVLLIFGLQWLRKAILRASGYIGMHDEDAIYEKTVASLRSEGFTVGRDRVAFVVAFKGVFLEGTEIVVAVLTLGSSAHRLGLAIVVASIAVVVVAIIGVIVARQLTKVPENLMKMSVGVMLVSFGTFWVGEGLRVRWPGGDTMLLALVVLYAVVTFLMIRIARHPRSLSGELAHE